MRLRLVLAVLGLAVAALASTASAASRAPAHGLSKGTVDAPLRLAFYYPWFPEGWHHGGLSPFTHFTPSLGFYDAGVPSVIRRHIQAMRWGRIRGGIYSWWGPDSLTDRRFITHLDVARGFAFDWAVYHELEGYGDPSAAEIRADLEYIRERYAAHPSYLRVDGRFVVFVYGDADDGASCDVAGRWSEGSTGTGAYLVLKAFRGFRLCERQPDGWHTYLAERPTFDLSPFAFSVTPGFFYAPETRPRLVRNLPRWRRSVRRMVSSRARFHLVLSFNEWGEGTAVESAREWASRSGYGSYLDALRAGGR